MERPGVDFSRVLGSINKALSRYQMNCKNRIAVWLSQVRHETASLTVYHQPADNGAGSLHMIPANWGYACKAIPEVKQAFASKFSGCGNCECTAGMATDPFGAAATKAALEIFSMPDVTFLTGAWWFAEGAKIPGIFGWKGCGDLRSDSDKGLGGRGSGDCKHSGYHQVTCCVFWTIDGSAGLQQRIAYYNTALRVMNSRAGANADDNATNFADSDHPPSEATSPSVSPMVIALILGGSVLFVGLIVAAIMIKLRGSAPREEQV